MLPLRKIAYQIRDEGGKSRGERKGEENKERGVQLSEKGKGIVKGICRKRGKKNSMEKRRKKEKTGMSESVKREARE